MSAGDERDDRAGRDVVGADEGRGDDAVHSEERTPGFRRDEVDAVGLPYHPVWSTFAMLLHGPVLWAAHFLFVYLAVEWACAQGGGPDVAIAWTVWPTVLVAVAIVVGTTLTARQWREATDRSAAFSSDDTETTEVDPTVRDRAVLGIGLMLGGLSLIAVVAVGVTALLVPPC